ncbi:predicted protein [Naegleria gruberi]|uniref:Predicted protein n=1 Tax=Naegleria gruberi TaxID=5762 RepID=D2VPR5_NAEGR|nr:uncharacterized protein NAEGRDRAFT_70957 [Naegleria gruberi]EFC41174.1 predicted protein [Naegleria gruberi]|eukprot:XP_002673918.1 predicted protein [Naegleria gruberi strain NEG-M]
MSSGAMVPLSDKERQLVTFLYRSIMKACRKYDQYPLSKTTLPNPAFTKSESIMTRGWTCTKFGKEILDSIYGHGGMYYIPRYVGTQSSAAEEVKTGKELLNTNKWAEREQRRPITLTDMCKKAFRKPELLDEQVRQEAYETGFGFLSEFNSHWDKTKKEEEKGNLILRKVDGNTVSVELTKKGELEHDNFDEDSIVANSYNDMLEDERIAQISQKPYIPENLEKASVNLVCTSRPLKNHLLIAHPMLANKYFERTVIRMDDNIQDTGYIVGKLSNDENTNEDKKKFEDLLEDDEKTPESEAKAKTLMDFVSQINREFESLEKKHSKEAEPERLARWYTHQLANEILDGVWIVVAVDMEAFLPFAKETPYDKVWEYLVSRLGGEYECWKDYFVNKQAKPLKERNEFPKVKIIVL